MREIVAREIDKARPRLGVAPGVDTRALDALCDSIVAQLLHAPITELKRAGEDQEGAQLVEFVQRLFRLDVDATSGTRDAPTDSDAELSADMGRRRS